LMMTANWKASSSTQTPSESNSARSLLSQALTSGLTPERLTTRKWFLLDRLAPS